MGLLDSVIGALGGGASGGASGGGRGGAGGGGQAALINIVLGMLANRGGGQLGAGGIGGSGGGPAGGLGDLMARFQQGGIGDVVASWIGTGQNLPVSGDQLSNVLGSDMLGSIASQLGISNGEVASQLSEVLPEVVDKLTPDGHVPEGGFGDIGTILGRFDQR